MRRKDREIKDFREIAEVLNKCEVCRIALNDDGYPYIVPLSFAVGETKGKTVLYFHSATEGKKTELIKKDSRAAFEADCSNRLFFDEEKGNCTTEYESVTGKGKICFVDDESEKIAALKAIMRHYGREDFAFNFALLPYTAVLRLEVESISGKRNMKRR